MSGRAEKTGETGERRAERSAAVGVSVPSFHPRSLGLVIDSSYNSSGVLSAQMDAFRGERDGCRGGEERRREGVALKLV